MKRTVSGVEVVELKEACKRIQQAYIKALSEGMDYFCTYEKGKTVQYFIADESSLNLQ